MVERHPEGSDEPWIPTVICVPWVPPDSFRSVGECILDLSRTTDDSRIIRFENSEWIGESKDCGVDRGVVGLDRFQEPVALLVPQVFENRFAKSPALIRP